MKALVIPAEGPLLEVELDEHDQLAQLQALVGGLIEALPIPGFIQGAINATAYVNEEGNFLAACKPNMRATDFMVPGIGLSWGTVIRGSLVLCGFNAHTGNHDVLPVGIIARARLIEREAGPTSTHNQEA